MIVKNIRLANIDVFIIENPLDLVCRKDPNATMIVKLKYTEIINWYPSIKSDIINDIVGIIKASFLSFKKAPPNNAIAPIAVKLGGWGINLVVRPKIIKK